MAGSEIAPVRKEIVVDASQERAFEVFTAQIGTWWPASHQIGSDTYATSLVEPRVGGRWYEVGTTGAECDWGSVLAWEPPSRVLLSWNIGPDWQFNPDVTKASEVEVRFVPLSSSRTRVELEHRNIARHGEGSEQMRTSVDSPGGWTAILQSFQAQIDGAAVEVREERAS